MKKTISFLALLLWTSSPVLAQFEWLELGHDGIEKYRLGLDQQHLLSFDNYFLAVDSTATVKFTFSGDDSTFFYEVFEMPDTSRVYFGEGFSSYFGSGALFGNRIDPTWDMAGLTNISCNEPCNRQTLSVPYDAGTFIKCEVGNEFRGYFAKTSAIEDDVLWLATTEPPSYYRSLAVLGGNIFVCSDLGLYVFNGNGDSIAHYPAGIYTDIYTFNDNDLLAINGDTLFHFTQDFVMLDTIVITDGHIEDIDVSFGRVGVLTTSNRYIIFDYLLAEIMNTTLDDYAFLDFEKTEVGPNSFFLAGNFIIGPSVWPLEGAFIKEYGLNGIDTAPRKDMGVTALSNLADAVVYQQGGKYYVQYDSLLVTVHNFGDTAIHNFILMAGCYDHDAMGAFIQGSAKSFYAANPSPLQPGESRTIVWKEARISFNQNPAGRALDLCILTSRPNKGFDVNPSNDMFCTGYVVSIKEPLQVANFALSPNPTSDYLHIDGGLLPLGQATIRISGADGRVMQDFRPIDLQGQTVVSVRDLPAGPYWLQVLVGDKPIVGSRFIKL